MTIINIGILAHVDGGKTSLTESILYESGSIDGQGKVDQGNTVTDNLALERQRGITIKASTVSTKWQGTKINIIDTPGHMDFISEVERSFNVLDGAVLIISAKEGVQEQTRVIYKKLQERQIPTVIFINKIDLPNLKLEVILAEVQELLKISIIPLQDNHLGPKNQEKILNQSERLETRFLKNERLTAVDYYKELRQLNQEGQLVPYYLGSAIKNSGITNLLNGMIRFFKPALKSNEGTGYVYKIDYDDKGSKQTYLRLFGTDVNYGDKVKVCQREQTFKLKNLLTFESGKIEKRKTVQANDILLLSNNDYLRIGDVIGLPLARLKSRLELLPTLKAVVQLKKGGKRRQLLDALLKLTEEDPTLAFEIDPDTDEIKVMLYGEVQKEVLIAYLAERFALSVTLGNSQIILKETLEKSSAAKAYMTKTPNPYWASLGLRCEPLPAGTGNQFFSEISHGYLTKSFQKAVWEGLAPALNQGLYGWELIDTKIILDFAEFESSVSAPADFRNLAPYVLWSALEQVGTKLKEPDVSFEIYVPQYLTGRVLGELRKIAVSINNIIVSQSEHCLIGRMSEELAKEFHPKLISITNGKGLFLTQLVGYTAIKNQENYPVKINSQDPLRVMFKKSQNN